MKTHIVAMAASVVLLAPGWSAADVTFSDGAFNNADWQMSQLFQFGNGGNVTGTQELSGGNPGSFRRIANIVNSRPGGQSNSAVLGFHQWLPTTYDPSTQGAIGTIDGTLDYENISGFGQGQAFALALLQNGKVYHVLETATFTVSGWQHTATTGLTANDFFETIVTTFITWDPNQHPDFSANGAPIAFGFTTRDATTDRAFTITNGYDNWSMTAHSVPEPSTALLALAGIVGVAVVAQRTRRVSA